MHDTGVWQQRAHASCRGRHCLQKTRWSVCLYAAEPQPQPTAVTPASTSPHHSLAGQEGGSAQACSHGGASPAPAMRRSHTLTKHVALTAASPGRRRRHPSGSRG